MVRLGKGVLCLLSLLVLAGRPLPVAAQADRPGRLVVTVTDATGAVVAGATVTLSGADAATKARAPVVPVRTTERGLGTIENVPQGLYSLTVEFPGFEAGVIKETRVRTGENRLAITLRIRAVEDSVTVGADRLDTVASRSAGSFGQSMTTAEIATLSDDPAELERQIREMAGPDAILRVDSFEGAQLPPRSQIKSVHVTRDQFAAESEQPGSTFVDVITQPGIGAFAGGANFAVRVNEFAGRSQFVETTGPESNRTFSGNVGGTIVRDRSNFSISINGQNQFTTPILNQVGRPPQLLNIRQPNRYVSSNSLLDYALTRDQTLRFGFATYNQRAHNQGIGNYDSPERAFSTAFDAWQFRVQQAGPIGRRTFFNARLIFTRQEQASRAAVESPTVIIQDSKTTGGAQVAGSSRVNFFNLATDVDYIRGIHSWRAGFVAYGGWWDSDRNNGYLGTYTFADQAAFDAGTPLLYTRTIGDPRVRYFMAQGGIYLQDDIKFGRKLTLSPGVRYSLQTHVDDYSSLSPRFGLTWAPFAGGRTTFRLSAGFFTYFMEAQGVYEQGIRYDGNHQRQVLVTDPSYPDPGVVVAQPPNQMIVGNFELQRNLRYSGGVDHAFSSRLRVNVLYNYVHQVKFWSARNANRPVDGVRPNPEFANIIEAVTDGEVRRHEVHVNANGSLAAASPALNAALFNWRRLTFTGSFSTIHARNNSEGPWNPPPSGTVDTEWGPSTEQVGTDRPYRLVLSATSTQLRNLNANISWTGMSGTPYTMTTGLDDNGDGIIDDRPEGVGRRTLRTASQSTLNLRLAYTILSVNKSAAGGAPAGQYRMGVSVNATNLTNRANYGGYSGVMTSENFLKPTMVVNPRRVDVALNLGF